MVSVDLFVEDLLLAQQTALRHMCGWAACERHPWDNVSDGPEEVMRRDDHDEDEDCEPYYPPESFIQRGHALRFEVGELW